MIENDITNTKVQISLRIQNTISLSKELIFPSPRPIFSSKERKLTIQTSANTERQYLFDYIFDKNATQEHVFEMIGKELIHHLLDGSSVCLLAYGQVDSGKTYTVFGKDGEMKGHERGLLPRMIEYLFLEIDKKKVDFNMKFSFFELYNGQIGDLTNFKKNISANNKEYIFQICGLHQVDEVYEIEMLNQIVANSISEIIPNLEISLKQRENYERGTQNYTNQAHTFFSLELEIPINDTEKTKSHLLIGDLSSSEYNQKDFTHLRNIIHKIRRGDIFIPYHQCILTKVLQKWLNLKSYITLIANVIPSPSCFDESRKTIDFANYCRSIAFRKEEIEPEEVESLRKKLKEIEMENMLLKEELKQIHKKYKEEKLTLKKQIGKVSRAFEESTNRPFVPLHHHRITPELKREVEEELREQVEKRLTGVNKLNEQLQEKINEKVEIIHKLKEDMARREEIIGRENANIRRELQQAKHEVKLSKLEMANSIKRLQEMHRNEIRQLKENHTKQLEDLTEYFTKKVKLEKQKTQKNEKEKTQEYNEIVKQIRKSNDNSVEEMQEMYKKLIMQKDAQIEELNRHIRQLHAYKTDYIRQLECEVQLLIWNNSHAYEI